MSSKKECFVTYLNETYICKVDNSHGDFITGDTNGFRNEDFELFEIALKKTGLSAGEVLHIGDSLSSDIKGANSVGINAIWINRTGKDIPDKVTAVSNLLEVLSYL